MMSPQLPVVLLFAALSTCQAYTINSRPNQAPTDLSYTISPSFIAFPGHTTLLDVISRFNGTEINHLSAGKHSAKVSNFLAKSCSMEFTTHTTSAIPNTELMRLLNVTLGSTDMLCHTASHRIGMIEYREHTMLPEQIRIELLDQPQPKTSEAAFLEYNIRCVGAEKKGPNDDPGSNRVDIQRDCGWCQMIAKELTSIQERSSLGALVKQNSWKLKNAVCEACPNVAST